MTTVFSGPEKPNKLYRFLLLKPLDIEFIYGLTEKKKKVTKILLKREVGILERWQSRKDQESVSPLMQQLHRQNLSDVTILELWSLLRAYNFQGKN